MRPTLSYYFHMMSISPLMYSTLIFIAGIWLQFIYNVTFKYALCLFAITFLLFLIEKITQFRLFIAPQKALLLCFVFALGPYLLMRQIQNQNSFYAFVENKKCDITGQVIDKGRIQRDNKFFITINVDEIKHEETSKKYNKKIIFYTSQKVDLEVGDTALFPSINCRKKPNESFSNYLIKESIAASIFLESLNFTILHRPSWSFRGIIFYHRQRLIEQFEKKLSLATFNIFAPLFLGYRAFMSDELNDQFKTWGLSHLLARSGLHLAVFVMIWQTLLCVIPLPFMLKQLFMTILCLLYFLLSWPSIPFIRAFALFILYKQCVFFKNPFHFLHYLSLVTFSFLVQCPINLFFLDFQLTFILTAALAWFNQLQSLHKTKL